MIKMASLVSTSSALDNATNQTDDRNILTQLLHDRLLDEQNDENAILLLPVISIVSILMVLGFVGNSLVVYVYMTPKARQRRSTQRTFILTLAMFDIMNCVLVIPFEIYDMRNQYVFHSTITCKLFRFIETTLVLSSGFTLLAVSIDRYIHLTKPSKNILTPTRTKALAFSCVLFSVLFSWPVLFFAGTEDFSFTKSGFNLTATECTSFRSNAVQIFSTKHYVYILMLTFISALIALVVFYTLIGIKLFKRRRGSTKNGLHYVSSASCSTSSEGQHLTMKSRNQMRLSSVGYVIGKNKVKVRGPTIVFYSVTVVFILGFLPHLIVRVLKLTEKAFVDDHGADYVEVLYNLLVRSYMINNAANPFIYSILNVRFRKALLVAFKRCFGICTN